MYDIWLMTFEIWGTYKTAIGGEKCYEIFDRSNTLCTLPASGTKKTKAFHKQVIVVEASELNTITTHKHAQVHRFHKLIDRLFFFNSNVY